MLKYSTYSNAVIAPYEADARGRRKGRPRHQRERGAGRASCGAAIDVYRSAVEDHISRARYLAHPGSADRVILAALFRPVSAISCSDPVTPMDLPFMPGVPLAWIRSHPLQFLAVQGPGDYRKPARISSFSYPNGSIPSYCPRSAIEFMTSFPGEHRDFLAVVAACQNGQGKKGLDFQEPPVRCRTRARRAEIERFTGVGRMENLPPPGAQGDRAAAVPQQLRGYCGLGRFGFS